MKADISAMRETPRDMMRKDELSQEIAVIDPTSGRAIIIARIYYPGNVAYACVWIHGKAYARGTGKASGYGYHKASAALAAAIQDAGIKLSHSVSGVGDRVMTDACEAIARAVTGKRRLITHIAHP